MTGARPPAPVEIRIDPRPDEADLRALWRTAWGDPPDSFAAILDRSLAHLAAYDGDRLVGFVNVAWDGGVHATILDPIVHPDYRRRSVGTRLVSRAASVAGERGAHWLHVDYEPHLEEFYQACGFAPTAAGLIKLR